MALCTCALGKSLKLKSFAKGDGGKRIGGGTDGECVLVKQYPWMMQRVFIAPIISACCNGESDGGHLLGKYGKVLGGIPFCGWHFLCLKAVLRKMGKE